MNDAFDTVAFFFYSCVLLFMFLMLFIMLHSIQSPLESGWAIVKLVLMGEGKGKFSKSKSMLQGNAITVVQITSFAHDVITSLRQT